MKRILLLLLISSTLSSLFSQAPVKKVLVEKFTSAFCGNCPRATLDLVGYESMNPNLIWVAHHSPWVISDAMHTTDIDAYYTNYTNSAPRATIDRKKYPNQSKVATSSGSWNTHITNQTAATADLSVGIAGTYNVVSREIMVDITSNFYNSVAADDRRVNLFLVETDILVPNTQGYNQANYDNNNQSSPLYNLGDPITNYVHKNVTRAVISDTWGTTGAIPATPAVNTDYTQSFTYTIPANYDISNSYLVAFVTRYDANDINNHEVLNVEQLDISALQQTGLPDLTPVTTVVPGNLAGISQLSTVVTITELGYVDTDPTQDIIVRIPSDSRYSFTFNQGLTQVGFNSVENARFTYLGNNSLFHQFRLNGVLAKGSQVAFGVIGTYDPQNTSGSTTITATIAPMSGGESNFSNNSDAETIWYFD